MPRYKLTLEYAGTRYSGWQRQQNAKTIEGELQRAIREGLRVSRFETYGSGRTDAGVHALRQAAHLDLPGDGVPRTSSRAHSWGPLDPRSVRAGSLDFARSQERAVMLPPEAIVTRINEHLPHDINVLSAERVPARFHARHSAVARGYLYQVALRRTAFAKPFVWWVRDPLEVDRMRAAAAHVTGFGDFRAFTDDDPEEKSTKVLVEQLAIEPHGGLLLVRVVGSHFLWKMVRRIVGVLVEVGRGGLDPDAVAGLLKEDSPDVARLTAPASGLFLERVFYEGDRKDWPVAPAVMVTD